MVGPTCSGHLPFRDTRFPVDSQPAMRTLRSTDRSLPTSASHSCDQVLSRAAAHLARDVTCFVWKGLLVGSPLGLFVNNNQSKDLRDWNEPTGPPVKMNIPQLGSRKNENPLQARCRRGNCQARLLDLPLQVRIQLGKVKVGRHCAMLQAAHHLGLPLCTLGTP